jgi:CheY-like chemotaxis protein
MWLLIEDDVDDQDFFVMALTSITDRVDFVIANNGLEALKIIQQDDNFVPSCIFVDLNMPLMDGFNFLQELKKIERLAEVPRIVFTTSNAAADKERASKLGAGFATKYSSLSDLQMFIRNCLSLYAAAHSNSTKNRVAGNYESLLSNFISKLESLKNGSIHDNNDSEVYGLMLDSAMNVMDSDLASIQLYCNATQQLKLVATKNIHPRSTAFWQTVSATSGSICGEALRTQTRITVTDVETLDFVKEEIEIFRLSGIRAVQSTPLVSKQGKLVGMISTHWKEQRQFSENDFEFFDDFARLAADIISQKTA